MRKTVSLTTMGVLVAACVSTTEAHRPIFSDGSGPDAETAIRIDDVTVSQVVYHEIAAEGGQLWLFFDGQAGQNVSFQLGVPVIESLRDFRPAVAILGPGLGQVDVPFDVPGDVGGLVVTTDDVTAPEFFHEPFTGTDSWILREFDVTLPESGRYYAVAYVPAFETGKLWVAVGKREVFGLDDIVSLPNVIARVRAFHEVATARAIPCCLPVLEAGLLCLGVLRIVRARRMPAGETGVSETPAR